MARPDHLLLEVRARRAYELGRVRLGLGYALFVVPGIALSILLRGDTTSSLALGGLAIALVTLSTWRGGAWAAAVVPGLVAGTVPLLLPLAARLTTHGCSGEVCWSVCMLSCVLGGLFAGGLMGLRAGRLAVDRGRFLVGAGAIAILSGSLGCAFAGLAGVAGMSLGLLAGSAPLVWLVARRTT